MQDRNLKTPFWRKAAASLPAATCKRYMLDIARAEQWELAIAGAVEVLTRAKTAVGRRLTLAT